MSRGRPKGIFHYVNGKLTRKRQRKNVSQTEEELVEQIRGLIFAAKDLAKKELIQKISQ